MTIQAAKLCKTQSSYLS